MQPNLLAELQPLPANHFKIYFYAAVLNLINRVTASFDSNEAAFTQFPFLATYYKELSPLEPAGFKSPEELTDWQKSLADWEEKATEHLPLKALAKAAGLDYSSLILFMTLGLLEEDSRFGELFAALNEIPGQSRLTMGLLNALFHDPADPDAFRYNLACLMEAGLVEVVNPEAHRMQWALQVMPIVWEALRSQSNVVFPRWLKYRPSHELTALDKLILPASMVAQLQPLPEFLASGEIKTLVIRGPQRNGRRSLAGGLAHSVDLGLLEINGLSKADDPRWQLIGPLGSVMRAMPVIVLDLAPGDTLEIPKIETYNGPISLILGKQGGLGGPGLERALSLTVELPDVAARRLLWQPGLEVQSPDFELIAERFHLSSGNIRRTAEIAPAYARLAGQTEVSLTHVQQACRALNRQVLETLAAPVATSGDWSYLATGSETMQELFNLESRCRYRESLQSFVGQALNTQLTAGVRALFTGPSGTGKTLAARLLAAVLQKDLYRLDLSAVVNKYIGETEKSLNRIFSRAEELDVVLLVDEGDALLTRRTNVQSANDRYANLETNYLLQRLETFEGILIITTNASDRIDSAFQRRMDVVVEFRQPDIAERWTIWQLLLPVNHCIDQDLLQEVVARCQLSGGQIRNAVLHASLLGLNDGGIVKSVHLEVAVQREYRKTGAVCPLRQKVAR